MPCAKPIEPFFSGGLQSIQGSVDCRAADGLSSASPVRKQGRTIEAENVICLGPRLVRHRSGQVDSIRPARLRQGRRVGRDRAGDEMIDGDDAVDDAVNDIANFAAAISRRPARRGTFRRLWVRRC